jgi:hypothetical protein
MLARRRLVRTASTARTAAGCSPSGADFDARVVAASMKGALDVLLGWVDRVSGALTAA